jgi:STE24 endopeptidase
MSSNEFVFGKQKYYFDPEGHMKKLFFFSILILLTPAHDVRNLHASQEPTSGTLLPSAVQDSGKRVSVPEPDAKAVSYYRSGNILWIINQTWGILIPALFLLTGFSARIRDWAQGLGRRWFFLIAIYWIIFAALNFLIQLPLSYYEEFTREHAYGLSNQTFHKWMSDSMMSLTVELITGIFLLWIPYWLLKKSPRRWWLYSGLLSVPFLFFAMLISPIWIDPLFNHFGPMKDKALEGEILSLARRSGIEGGRVYEVDKSIDTNAVNAYVTGFMGTKRIVLWDTIIAKLNRRELLVVMAHESGHYVLHHIVYGIAFAFLIILISLYITYRLAAMLMNHFKRGFGFDQLSDIASLPLLLFLAGVISLFVSPAMMAFSRYQEHEADRFALEITRDNYAAATTFVKLEKENLAIPRPGWLYRTWRASHPSIGERIEFCNEYRPWEKGIPLKYGGRLSR